MEKVFQGFSQRRCTISANADIVLGMKQVARFFKTLSDETRLRILVLLSQGELCVCDLVATLALPQSTVSRHLATLRHAGLVDDRRQGVWMYYRLAEGDNTLVANLLPVLRPLLVELPEALADLEALETYLQQNQETSCH